MVEISVVIPTRGLITAACISSVLDNLAKLKISYHVMIQPGLPLPACFNIPIENELRLYEPKYVWLVEEDVEVPHGALDDLIVQDRDIAAVDYPLATGYGCVAYYKGKPMWTGTGCTLIRSDVFRRIGYFRSDIAYEITKDGFFRREGIKNTYGGHDIEFCIRAQLAGFSIGVVPNRTARHWKIAKQGNVADNSGVHTFVVYDHIKHSNVLSHDPRKAIDR